MNQYDLLRCELLVVRCWRRDESAAQELTEMFQAPLVFYLRRLVGSEADAWDLTQETWLTVFRSLPTLREPRALPAYLYRVARNAALAHLRRNRAADVALIEAANERAADTTMIVKDTDFSAEDAEAVHLGLDRLSLPHRETLTLYFLDELSLKEIASVVGVPEGTIKSRLFHAKQALRRVLEGGSK